jgi:hypothetical protein
MNYWTTHTWEIEKENDKYVVGKFSNEVMRLSGDGSLGIGGGKQLLEKYEFQTYEWAQLMLNFCQRLDGKTNYFSITSGNYSWAISNTSIATFDTSWSYSFANKEIVKVDSSGKIVKFDLPFIVLQWLKLSKLTKFINTLMWGEKGKK